MARNTIVDKSGEEGRKQNKKVKTRNRKQIAHRRLARMNSQSFAFKAVITLCLLRFLIDDSILTNHDTVNPYALLNHTVTINDNLIV